MKAKADRDESSPYAAMLSSEDVAQRCKELGITTLHMQLLSTGGNKTKTPDSGVWPALRALARSGMKIGRRLRRPERGCSATSHMSRGREPRMCTRVTSSSTLPDWFSTGKASLSFLGL